MKEVRNSNWISMCGVWYLPVMLTPCFHSKEPGCKVRISNWLLHVRGSPLWCIIQATLFFSLAFIDLLLSSTPDRAEPVEKEFRLTSKPAGSHLPQEALVHHAGTVSHEVYVGSLWTHHHCLAHPGWTSH